MDETYIKILVTILVGGLSVVNVKWKRSRKALGTAANHQSMMRKLVDPEVDESSVL